MRKLILLIEDDESFRSTVFELLELEDFNVVSAEDGLLGLKLARQIQPDLILCDINMPSLNGYGIIKELRKDLATAKIPVIFITARTDRESRSLAFQLGANDYLTKPVQFNRLLSSIINQCQQSA